MQWRLFTAGAVLAGLSTAGLVVQHLHSGVAAAEPPMHTSPTTSPSSMSTSTSARPSSTRLPATTTSSTQPQILPSYPPAVPGQLARAIAGRDSSVCALFTPAAAQQLAAATGTASCPAAIEALNAKVTNTTSYANPTGAGDAQPAGDRRVTVDACHLVWTEWGGSGRPPGPQIGRLTLEQQQGSVGYLIAGYRSC